MQIFIFVIMKVTYSLSASNTLFNYEMNFIMKMLIILQNVLRAIPGKKCVWGVEGNFKSSSLGWVLNVLLFFGCIF